MNPNRIEYLSGRRWAVDFCFKSENLLRLKGGHEKLLEMLKRGLIEKPESYAEGVQEIIETVEGVIKS